MEKYKKQKKQNKTKKQKTKWCKLVLWDTQ